MDTHSHVHLGGSKRDPYDARDFRFAPAVRSQPLPARVDLRPSCGEVYYQLPLHSCSAHAFASLLTLVANVEKRPIEPPSRLFIYYNSRKFDGSLPADDGATMRSAMKSIAVTGACSETLWPYDTQNVSEEPPEPCYAQAKGTRALQYSRIAQDLDHLRACLAEGYGFAFGMQAYVGAFTAAQHSGTLAMPTPGDTVMGGHAVLAVGYDDEAQTITALNSLGATWGDGGYFTVPYAFVLDATLAYDFWTVRSVS